VKSKSDQARPELFKFLNVLMFLLELVNSWRWLCILMPDGDFTVGSTVLGMNCVDICCV